MAISFVLSAPPATTTAGTTSNCVLPVIRSASLSRLPLAFGSRSNPQLCRISHGSHHLITPLSSGLHRPGKYIMAANSNVQPAPPPPPPPPSDPSSGPIGRKGWIAGIVVTLLLPFLKSKWGPLLFFKDKFDTNLQKVEDTVEAVEKVAEGLEKAAEDFAEKLPDGRLKTAVNMVEHAAEEVAKDAHLTDAVIEQFQELEVKAEAFVESRSEKPSKTIEVEEAKAANEQDRTA